MFSDALRVQLIAKGIIRPDEWEDIRANIKYDYLEDNHYSELKDAELLQSRLGLLQVLDPYVGKYYSMEWARKNVLHLDDEDIKEIDKQIKAEGKQMLAIAQQQGEIQLAQQQPMMGAQQEQQQQAAEQQMAMQQQAGAQDQGTQDQQPQDGGQDAGADQAAAQETQQPTQKKSTPKQAGWPN